MSRKKTFLLSLAFMFVSVLLFLWASQNGQNTCPPHFQWVTVHCAADGYQLGALLLFVAAGLGALTAGVLGN